MKITRKQISLVISAMRNLPMGAFICDKNGVVQFINTAYANYLRLLPEDIIGRHITEIIPDSCIPRVLRSGKAELCQLRRFPDRTTNLVVNRVPLFDGEELIGALSMAIFDTDEQVHVLLREVRSLDKQVNTCQRQVKSALSAQYTIDSIVGNTPAIVELKKLLRRYASTDAAVFIFGPTGTGKELVAAALHNASLRADGPFVAINCGAIPNDLFEAEVFGYAPGAFSGARRDGSIGKIEMAHQGTLFLDEVGELSLQAQAKLLRALEDKTFFRLGGSLLKRVDFRLIAASNRDLQTMVDIGKFREDLYYRIKSMSLRLPPLKQRKDDIPLLVRHFLVRMNAGDVECSTEAMNLFRSFSWPGNIRELRNAVGHALCLSRDGRIEVHDLPEELRSSEWKNSMHNSSLHNSSLYDITRSTEAQTIEKALRKSGGNKVKAAALLGISRAALYAKLKKLGGKIVNGYDVLI